MSKLDQDYTLGKFPVHTAAKKPEKLTIGRFLDIAQLSLGMGAYVAWLEAQDKKPDPLLKKGRTTARRYRGQFEEGFTKFFGPIMDRDDVSRLKPAWRRAMRAGAPDVVFVRKGEFFKVAMPWLRMHQQVMRDLFTGKAYQIALRIAQAVGADDPMSTLAKLAVIPPASGLRIPRKWNEDAAKAVGAEPSTTESVMVDAAEAQAQAEKLRDVQTALDAADPGSEEEAELGAEKAAIQSEIEEIAAESKDPSAVRATAIAASAEQPTSKIAQKAGLTPEQADALVAEGNIIITAGAGAGKTKTLAAKVAYFIEEKGYRPEQIMATSFTNASAAELRERVAAEFGITEANIGTTHSIAKQIIKAFRPDWEGALNAAPSGEINKLFRIAMAQTELMPDARAKRWAAEGREAAWGGRGRGRGGGGGGGGYRNLYKDALGKWFNLGEKLLDQKGRPIGAKRLKNYIGKWKMGGWSPDQAWDFYQGRRDESMVAYFAAAVYGAYEYLKNDDAQFAPAFDFDDWLLKATEILEQDPRALESLQRRYKVVLVDEAQDLNATQHKMFGLIAAQADTFAMIGDDKQAIYGFRGAILEGMTELPEKGFDVKQLALNFRSGASIVEAGNSVISHNTGQIPMKCYANVERKGMGQIRAVETGTHEEAAAFAANEIKQNLDAGTPLADEKGTPQFGILVRNNAEADAYALALMAHGIPFRTKTDFFNKPIIKAALAWLTINTGKPDEAVNDAIVNAHSTPGFYLDKKFGYWMGKRCGRDENYLQYLLGGGPVYDQAWRDRKMVAAYREVVEQVTAFEGDTAQVLRMIMDIRGSKQSFQDSLIEQINPDDLADDLGREPTEEEIKEAALVPIRPVMRVADNFEDPTKMMDFIGKLQRANAKHRKDEENTEPAVQIGTVHGWKGLEAYNVWISMAGGVFPPDPELMARDATPDPIIKPQTMEDERRLAYVAITRGMDSVSIMSPRENYRGMEAGMSQFIDEACVGIEGYTRPEEDEEAAQDSPPPGRSASEQSQPEQLGFGEILDGFLKGATLEDFYEDDQGPETELEADWEYLP